MIGTVGGGRVGIVACRDVELRRFKTAIVTNRDVVSAVLRRQ